MREREHGGIVARKDPELACAGLRLVRIRDDILEVVHDLLKQLPRGQARQLVALLADREENLT